MNERDLIQRWIEWKEKNDRKPFPQKKLADDAGISPTYLSTILTGTRNAGTKTIERIAQAIGVTVSEFYAGPSPDDDALPSDLHEPKSPHTVFTVSPVPSRESVPPEPVLPHESPVQQETGLKFMGATPDRIDRLFDSFGYSMGDTFTPRHKPEQAPPRSHPPVQNPVSESPSHRPSEYPDSDAPEGIPLLSRAPSGHWRDWIGDIRRNAVDMVSVIPVDPGRAFAVKIEDSSMAPKLDAGAVLVVNPEARFMSFDGGIGVVARDGRFSVRHVYAVGDSFILVPSNPAFFPEVIPAKDVQVFEIAFSIPK